MEQTRWNSEDPIGAARRSFLKLISIGMAVFWGLVLGVPLVSFLLGPAFRKKKRRFVKVSSIASFQGSHPVPLTFVDEAQDGFIKKTALRSVWAVRRNSGDVVVYSPICPHLGCWYNWDSLRQQFVCPCHNSMFALDGHVVSGPAPRSLDTLKTKITNGELFVEWERFKLGIPKKIGV